MRIFSKSDWHSLGVITLVLLSVLTPIVNVSGPLLIKSLDVYASLFFVCYAIIYSLLANVTCAALNKILAGCFSLLLCQVLLVEIIYQQSDELSLTFFRLMITVIAAYGCSLMLIRNKKEKSLEFFFLLIVVSAILQGIVIWLSFLFPAFRDFMSLFFYRDSTIGNEHLVLLRVPGFVATGGDGLSMNQALLATTGLMGVYMYFKPGIARTMLAIALLASMLSVVFTGRSGLYLGILFSVLIVATQSKGFEWSQGIMKGGLLFILILLPILIFAQQIGVYAQSLHAEHGYEYPLVRLLRGFMELEEYGSYGDETVKTLLTDMVIIPDEATRFLWGNGNFGQVRAPFLGTDVAYFRMWHGVGIIGLMVFIFGIFVYPVLVVRRMALRVRAKLESRDERLLASAYGNLLVVVLLFGLIAHYKVFYLSARVFGFIFFVLLYLAYHQLRSAHNPGN